MNAEKQKTILLVDDETIIAMTEKITLEKYGYKVIIANSGNEAVAAVETTPAIDLVLMDVNLGAGIDGTEAAAIILRQRDLPVVFLSSHMEPEVVAKTEKITSYGYVVKNSSITVLDASIKMAFKLFESKIKEKEKESLLCKSEEKFKQLFAQMPSAVAIYDAVDNGEDFVFKDFNIAAEKIEGIKKNDLVGKRVTQVFPGVKDFGIFAVLQRVWRTGQPEFFPSAIYRDERSPGTWRENWVYKLASGEVVAIYHDITERKRAEDAIFLSKKDWEECFDSITDMITIHDSDYNIIRTNKAAKVLLKFPALAGHLKLKCFSFYHGTDAPPSGCPSCDCLKSGMSGVFELFEPHLNRYLEIRAIPRFDNNNQRAGLIHIVRDITERKQAESQRETALEAMLKSENKFRSIFESSRDAIMTLEPPGWNFTSGNPVTVNMFMARDEADFNSHEPWTMSPECQPDGSASIEKAKRMIEIAMRDGSNSFEWTHKRLNGEEFPAAVLLTRMILAEKTILQATVRDITERKRAEELLRESEERMRNIISSMADWVWEVDKNGVYTFSSDKGMDLLGVSRGNIIGKTPFDFMPPDEAKRVVPIFSEIVANKLPIKDLENWNVGRNGEIICLLTNGIPIFDAKGNLKGYRGVDKDITMRKQAESLTEVLYKISQAIYTTDNLNELFGHVHRVLSSIIPTDNLFIALLSDDGKILNFPYNIDEKDSGDSSAIAVDNAQSLTAEVYQTKRSLLLDEAELLDRYATGRNKVWGTAPKCWLGVPLIIREKVIGVMAVQDYHKCGVYGQKDVTLLESTAGQIAIAIDRKRAESQRIVALEALRESEERFHSLFDNMGEGVALHELVFENGKSVNYRIIDINNRFLKIIGVSREQMIGKLATEAYGTSTPPYLKEYDEVGISKKPIYFETFFASLDKHFAISVAPWRKNGFATIFTDITERKQAEETLRTSEAQQSNALQMTKAGQWEYDVVHDVFTFNDNFYRIFRTTAAELGGYQMSAEDYARRFCHPDDAVLVGIETRAAIESPDPNYSRQIEHRMLYADGMIGYMAVRFFIEKDPQGRTVKTYGVNQDISERKLAEMEIKRQLSEKEILLREVHHRIKNNIASIGGLISLRLRSVTNPEAVAVLQDAIGRVDSLHILYDRLLLSEGYKDIPVKNYVESLADTIVAIFSGNAKVTVDKQIADFQLDPKRLFPLGLIINELITNKMKYAFINKNAGKIKISLKNIKNHVTLTILDNGVGLPDGFDISESKGFGLMLVKMLSQQLGGSFSMEMRAGTRCTIEFDI
jgi:PAS domain S-box-containing protein